MANYLHGYERKTKSCRRREVARHAAKDRRDKENDIFAELQAEIIETNRSNCAHIDRITLLRLAVTLVRLRRCVPSLMKTTLNDSAEEAMWSEEQITNCLHGFIMICDRSGTLLYCTESVAQYLGHTQTDMIGQILRNFVNSDDYGSLQETLNDRSATSESRLIVMRMKSVVGPRGRKRSSKTPLVKPITFCLRIVDDENTHQRICLLLATTTPICTGSLYNDVASHFSAISTFVTRHTCDMKFSYVDESLNSFLKLEPGMLLGTSFYDLVHPEDLPVLVKSLRELFNKLQCTTPYYRLMGGSEVIIWVQTEAGVVTHTSRSRHGKYIICIHQILGLQNDVEPNSVDMDAAERTMVPFVSKALVNASKEEQQMSSYEEVLRWLISDLPETLQRDPDTAPDRPIDLRFDEQKRQLSECTGIACAVSQSEADIEKLPSVDFEMDDGQLHDFNGNDIKDIQFEHLAIKSPSQQLLDGECCQESSFILTPQIATAPSTAEFLPLDDATDLLKTLAPFVAQEEILPLDMQGLVVDLNMGDWFQSDLEILRDGVDRPLETPPPPSPPTNMKNDSFEIFCI